MVFVWYRAKKFEMSLEDFEKGTEYIFPLVTADVIEHRGRTDFKNFVLLYGAREIEDKDIKENIQTKKFSDYDAFRVADVPEEEVVEGIEEMKQKTRSICMAFRSTAAKKSYSYEQIFSEPTHITKILDKYPMFMHDSHLLSILKDWPRFREYVVKNSFAKFPERTKFQNNPDFHTFVQKFIPALAKKFGIEIVVQPGVEGAIARPIQPTLNITQMQLQNALQSALSGMEGQRPARGSSPPPRQQNAPSTSGSSSGTTGSSSGAAASSSAALPVTPTMSFEEQMATLRSFGFYDDEMMRFALEQSNGEIEGAVDFLVSLRD